MGFEVELKFRAVDHDGLLRRLAELGARAEPAVAQEDTYLAHPCRDFAETNEAFRVRRVGPDLFLTYKGPKHPGETKTREEIELPAGRDAESYADLLRLFECLGFRPVATIRKVRTPFHISYMGHALEVALDVADRLGDFAEIETLAPTAEDLPAAQRSILDCAQALGLSTVEPRSYLRMVLESRSTPPRNPAGHT